MSANTQLVVDTDTLIAAGNSLRTISNEFGAAGTQAKEVANLVGHADVARAIRQFASKWNDKRAKLKESIDALATATTQIGQAFADIDQQLGDVLTAE